MVVLLDLDEHALHSATSAESKGFRAGWEYLPTPSSSSVGTRSHLDDAVHDGERGETGEESQRPNPNLNSLSRALGCYPIISQITASLDRNSLHDLALTCRQVRANILPFRRQLVARTLQCVNEELDEIPAARPQGLINEHSSVQMQAWAPSPREDEWPHELTTRQRRGKVSRCARDLVGECRRCGTVICRNCIVKPPPPSALSGRHRRLCQTCLAAPLDEHTSPVPKSCSFPSSPPVTPSRKDFLGQPECQPPHVTSFTSPAFMHGPCACPDSVWLCHVCGISLPSADATYHRVWSWRTRYSAYIGAYLGGGLGTGLIKGTEGVQCGRGGDCLAAKEIEVEVDCDAVDLANAAATAADATVTEKTPRSNSPWAGDRGPGYFDEDDERGPSYVRQEIEGIGGVVKKKIKRMERMGKVVNEWEDERDGKGSWMGREKAGEERSWCDWCRRVVPGKRDRE